MAHGALGGIDVLAAGIVGLQRRLGELEEARALHLGARGRPLGQEIGVTLQRHQRGIAERRGLAVLAELETALQPFAYSSPLTASAPS